MTTAAQLYLYTIVSIDFIYFYLSPGKNFTLEIICDGNKLILDIITHNNIIRCFYLFKCCKISSLRECSKPIFVLILICCIILLLLTLLYWPNILLKFENTATKNPKNKIWLSILLRRSSYLQLYNILIIANYRICWTVLLSMFNLSPMD